MKFTLRTKIILLTTVLVTAIMATITYFFTIQAVQSRQQGVRLQAERIARNIATVQLLDRQDWSDYQDYISQLMLVNQDIVYIAIFDDRKTLRAHTLNTSLVETGSVFLSKRRQAEIVKQLDAGGISAESRGDLLTSYVNIMVGDRVLGSVHVGFSIIAINNELHWRYKLNFGLSLVFILIAVALSVYFSRKITQPLENLSNAMQSISEEGKLQEKVVVQTRDEIGELATAYNAMIDGLRERQAIKNLGAELSATFNFDRLAPLVRDRLNSAIGASGTRMYIRNGTDSTSFVEISTFVESGTGRAPLSISKDIRQFLRKDPEGFLFDDLPADVKSCLSNSKHQENGLLMPMTVKDQLFGILFFELPNGRTTYTAKEKNFASTLANQAALALENSLLYQDLREQDRLRRELEIAHDFQQKLLPDQMPQLQNFEFDGVCIPAQEVGGDYFDFFPLEDSRLGIVIADVSGHGTSASFYMAQLRGMMLQLSTQYDSPKDLVVELNQNLCRSIESKAFVTMIYGILSSEKREFTFVRAGHHGLLHVEDGPVQCYEPAGLGLGLVGDGRFEEIMSEERITVSPGGQLFFYTDGLVEAQNARREEFGEDALRSFLETQTDANATELRERIHATLNDFLGSGYPHDDVTMIVVKCLC